MFDESTKIRVGIAGYGLSGRLFHAPFIAADSRFELHAVYERSADQSKTDYPDSITVRDYASLLDAGIDAIVITTPNPLHVSMAEQAIKAGKHVVVEKPAAITSAEVHKLAELAKEKGVLFTVYQNRRFDSGFLTAKKLIEDGVLGEIVDYRASFDRFAFGTNPKKWKAEGGRGIDILYDRGIHIIDQAYCLFGLPESVYADMRRLREESSGVDSIEVRLNYSSGLRAVLTASDVAAAPGPVIHINGRKGSFIKYGADTQEEALKSGKRPPASDWGADPPDSYGTLIKAGNRELISTRVPSISGNYGAFYDDLYNALTRGTEPAVKPSEAADVLSIVEAAILSNQKGCLIRI